MDLNLIKCRLCLTVTPNKLIDIFDNKHTDLPITLIIKKYFGFEVQKDDLTSKHLCQECWNNIKTFYNFQKHVNTIQSELIINDNKVNETLVVDDIGDKAGLNGLKRPAIEDDNSTKEVVVLSKKKLKQQLQSDPAVIEKQNKIIRDYIKMECELCSVVLDSFQSIQLHFRGEHNTRGYLRCCNRKFTKRFMLVEHIQRHINPEAFLNR